MRPASGSLRSQINEAVHTASQANPATIAARTPPLPSRGPSNGQSRDHSQPRPAAATRISSTKAALPTQMAPSATAPSTRAERIRRPRSPQRSLFGNRSARTAAESAFAPGELGECRGEMLLAEIRPQHVEEHVLRIGRLPEKEIGEPLLAG